METEVRERFERIERVLQGILAGMESFQKVLGGLSDALEQYANIANARMTRFDESLVSLREAMEQYAAASNVRMTRIEENLDALIRAITAEHKNGRGSS